MLLPDNAALVAMLESVIRGMDRDPDKTEKLHLVKTFWPMED